MHKVAVRFRFVKDGQIVECLLDERLSLAKNLQVLLRLLKKEAGELLVYDPQKKIFLDTGAPLRSFAVDHFISLYLFDQSGSDIPVPDDRAG